uniref:Secreted protein n=1 Tax=Anopheles merus TaxID=30066 RepID=A0A182V2P7_ANOME
MFSSLMSPWQIRCLWHWCSAHSIWNVIHFFSISVRNGRVETRSYRLCFTYCRTIRHAFSIVCERVAYAEKSSSCSLASSAITLSWACNSCTSCVQRRRCVIAQLRYSRSRCVSHRKSAQLSSSAWQRTYRATTSG